MLLHRSRVAILLMTSVSFAAAAQNPESPIAPGDVTAYAQLLAMTDTRQLDTVLVDRGLASRWPSLRAAAALAIGQVGADRGMIGAPRLRALLTDRDASVAANAAYAIGLLRDSASIRSLNASLSSNHVVAREAAWALGEIGAPARNAITAALKTSRQSDVTVQLLLAVAKLRPIAVAELRPFLHSGSPPVVWAAAYAIARTRSPAGVRDLMELEKARSVSIGTAATYLVADSAPYNDPRTAPARTRAEIARGLAKAAAGDSLGQAAFTVLTRLAGDKDSHVRINALRSLGTYGPQAKATLVNATRDRDANVRISAAQSFATVLTKDSDDFAALLTADTSLMYRTSLLAAAARAGLRPSELTEWTSSSDWRLRAAVASAEGDSLDRSFALARATPLTRDRDPRVREAAYGALAPPASMPLEDSVHTLLVSGLRDPDFYVRATIIGALVDRPSARDLPAVLASYKMAARDSGNDARLAAVQYVAAVWKKDSASLAEAARAELSALPIPADPLERAAGSSVSVWSKWKTVIPRPRPMGWYETIIRDVVVPVASGKSLNATINTVRGPIRLEMFGVDAPITVWNFLTLARSGYYSNTRFHRVVPNFVAQDGDPRDDGNGGPGYAIRDEMNRRRYERGAVGMALSGPDTGGSQYFITHSPQPHLDGHYTVFGRVISGFDVLDKLVQGDRITSITTR
jgi:cyclophilin family peptidyl-prolyl cis-trans isomerase/HEAT repeat protein